MWPGYNWRYALAMGVGVLIWLTFELHGAIVRHKPGDTWTELSRPLIHLHPVIWWTSLGATVGFAAWLILHLWFNKA